MSQENIAACRITGGVGCGKTQALIDRLVSVVESGSNTNTTNMLALCATPQAVLAFKQRLADASPAAAAATTVTTPRDLALNVLSDSEAIRWSGRSPRILTAYEELFLLEDMKTSGLRPKRLREMLKFFYRSWTELADDDENWLLPGEEANIHELLKTNLSFMQAIAEPEAANLAVNYLRSHEGARAAHAFAHVFVDDYQLISRASQQLAGLAASESITIAANPTACVQVYDSYPYAAGVDEFAEVHPNFDNITLTTCYNSAASASAADSLQAEEASAIAAVEAIDNADENQTTSEAAGSVGADVDKAAIGAAATAAAASAANSPAGEPTTLLDFDQPEDEFTGLGKYVSDLVNEGFAPEEIVVAVPNGTWGRNISKSLAAAGAPAEVLTDRQPVRGDIRNNAKCVPAHVLTALDLVADPKNALAWRCWCGYNDWLANSSAMASLRKYAEGHNSGLVSALSSVASDSNDIQVTNASETDHVVGALRVADAYKAGLALIEAAAGLEGEALLAKLTELVCSGDANANADVPPAVRNLCLSDSGDNSPAAMAARFRARLLAPTISTAGCVKVVPYDLSAGLAPKVLIISGFVNGFIPVRAYFDGAEMALDKQAKEHLKDVRRVYSMAGKASDRLVVSRFAYTDLETAAALKLSIGRIRLVDGVRTCKIPESELTPFLV